MKTNTEFLKLGTRKISLGSFEEVLEKGVRARVLTCLKKYDGTRSTADTRLSIEKELQVELESIRHICDEWMSPDVFVQFDSWTRAIKVTL